MRILYHHRTRAEDAQGVHIHSLCAAFEALGHEVEMVAPVGARKAGCKMGRASGREADRASGRASGFAVVDRDSGDVVEQLPSRLAPAALGEGSSNEDRSGHSLFGLPIPSWFYELLALAYNIPAFMVLLGRAGVRRPDFIYERYTLFTWAGWWVARLVRRPFILEVNAPLSLELQSHGSLVFSSLAQRMEDRLCSAATRTVVVSQAMAEIFASRGVPRERLLVIPNGVDADSFHAAVDGSAVRERYALGGCRVIGFVGWVRPWHGVDGLLLAMSGRLAEDDGVRLLIVGDGPALAGLRRLAEELGVAERVIFTGAVAREQIPAHIAALDIAVQPDVTDYASPIKLFEYLAIGRAVIAPDKANIREVVCPGESALLFAPRDWQALGKQIKSLLEDDVLRRRLASAAARLIRDGGYTWQGNAQRVIDVVAGDKTRATATGRS